MSDDDSKATHELYVDRGENHCWRLVHDTGNVIADSGEGYAARQEARQGIDSIRRSAAGADIEVLG